MYIKFQNRTDGKKDLSIYIEPSTDHFILKYEDEMKIYCESMESIEEVSITQLDETTIVIWLPRETKGIIYINNKYTESFSEKAYW